ncbi:MAG TPA: T9SS type A sorting domain-containing protein, partial [Adhaeribacter sp.]|nr:T9SS type A sorting domain-containing protein [Adhaeribacter sp.]
SFYDGTPLPAHFTTLSVCAGVAAVPEKDIPAWQPEIFPNPTTGLLYLSLPAGSGPFSATVTDVTGKTWISQNGQPANLLSLDLDALPKGMYLLRVQTGKGMTTRPILKF